VHLSSRRSDDADVIRARLRALLKEAGSRGGWVPADDEDDPDDGWEPDPPDTTAARVEVAGDRADEGLPPGIGRHRSPGPTARWDPGHLGARSLWLAGLVAALLLVGWTWLDRPRVELVPADPAGAAAGDATGSSSATSAEPAAPEVGEVAETSATVVVSVVGLVARPGLVTLSSGSRVADAVEAAGGLLPEADPASLNLAAVVSDGEQVAVGVAGAAGGAAGGAQDAPSGAGAGSAGSGQRVNLNTATAVDLDALPGIGPVLAGRIVDYRTTEGPFTSVDELDDVPGIGPAIAARLVELVTV
jgi:competence protein ComEA